MTLPLSGPISFDDINIELGFPSGTPITLDDEAVRSLAGIPTGTITLEDLYGKSAVTSSTLVVGSRTVSSVTYRGFSDGTGSSPFNTTWGSLIPSTVLPATGGFSDVIVTGLWAQSNSSTVISVRGTGLPQTDEFVSPEIRLNGGAWVQLIFDFKSDFISVSNTTYRNLIYNNVGSSITVEMRWPT